MAPFRASSKGGGQGKTKLAKAKCEANQAALDRLAAKRDSSSDRYAFTVKRAMDSLAASTVPIQSHQQALALKYVGAHCATVICPPEKERSLIQKRATAAAASSSSPACSVGSAASAMASAPPNTKKRALPSSCQAAASMSLAQLATTTREKPTAKEANYSKAVKAAKEWKRLGPLVWRVVLIVDGREHKSNHVLAKCSMSGIPCEERHLPIGDLCWMAQGMVRSKNGKQKNQVVVELVLGTIVERKSCADLESSLFGTRYHEQRLRLQHSGLPQVLFLIEGELTGEYAEHLHSAAWETRMHLGFSLVHTAHLEDTIQTLKRLHRRILQRTFPSAFQRNAPSALPTFGEAHSSSAVSQQEGGGGGRHRKRRIQSLQEMTFESDPTLPFVGMDRFVSYDELKAKIERDREVGTKTVGSIHLAMLKQVASCSDTKCQAVARAYPTANALCCAYSTATTSNEKRGLVAQLSTHDALKSQRNSRIGPKSAEELCIAYSTMGNDDGDESSAAAVGAAAAGSASIAKPAAAPTVTMKAAAPREAYSAAAAAEKRLQSTTSSSSKPKKLVVSKQPQTAAAAAAECVDLMSPDQKPPAKKGRPTSIDLSLDNEKDDSSSTGGKQVAKPSPAKRSLNTSLGFLDSSIDLSRDDEDDSSTGQKQLKPSPAKRSLNTSLGFLDSSDDDDDDESPANKRKAQIHLFANHGQGKPSTKSAVESVFSSDDDDGSAVGIPLRERLQARAVTIDVSNNQSRATVKARPLKRAPRVNEDVIEIE